jgi:hypothetical protein
LGGGNSLTYIKRTITKNLPNDFDITNTATYPSATVKIPTLTDLAFVYFERTSSDDMPYFSYGYAAVGGGYIDFNASIDQTNSKYYKGIGYGLYKTGDKIEYVPMPKSDCIKYDSTNNSVILSWGFGYSSDDNDSVKDFFLCGTYNIYFIYK